MAGLGFRRGRNGPETDPDMIPAASPALQPDPIGATRKGATDWKRHWRDAVRDPRELLALLGLQGTVPGLSDAAAAQFPLRVPRGFIARMRHGDPHDPLLRQVLPLDDEMQAVPGFVVDAVGDAAARAGHGVIHKYNGRALLIATGSCAVHCRYCFRRHFPYAEETAAAGGWQQAVDAIRADATLHEVILSGGDPLSLATPKLAELTDHANHAREFDASVDAALSRLRDAGASVLNQAVLLRGVNDSVDALAELSERSFAAGALPYYLHQLDRVAGAAHFEVPDARARELHAGLTARLSGYLVPKLVREVAGEPSKRPL